MPEGDFYMVNMGMVIHQWLGHDVPGKWAETGLNWYVLVQVGPSVMRLYPGSQ